MTPPFIFNTTKSLLFGAGRLNDVGSLATTLLGERILVVTDAGMVKTGLVDRLRERLSAQSVKVFADVVADPPETVIQQATQAARVAGATGILGFGGGSSLDVAKLVAVLALGREELPQLYGIGNVKGPRLPLMVVPTTAGTGSEVTPIAIVTTGTCEKMGVVSPVLLPDMAVLDPELTYGLPPAITAATGIDAMVHAIEAYASVNANNNPISKGLALQALQLMGRSLLKAVQKGGDAQARADMLLGSMLAGQAFANSPVAAVHALAYPLGGHCHIPHGLSNALVLPHVLRFNAAMAPEPYATLAPSLFPDLATVAEQERAGALCDRLADVSRACGLPQSLAEMQIERALLPRLAEDAMKQTRLLGNNPRPVTYEDALMIYQAAYEISA